MFVKHDLLSFIFGYSVRYISLVIFVVFGIPYEFLPSWLTADFASVTRRMPFS